MIGIIINNLPNIILSVFKKVLPLHVRAKIAVDMPPIISINTKHGKLKMYCAGGGSLKRAKRFFTSEPETLDWIDSFQSNSVFWDIGANVGQYTIYAGRRGDVNVLAFEPGSANYMVLNRNIHLMNYEEKITAYCLAFYKQSMLTSLNMKNINPGMSEHSVDTPVNWHGETFQTLLKQGALTFPIDEFIEKFAPPFPVYMKIDVDGHEESILEGAENTLGDQRLRSLLVELDAGRPIFCERIIDQLAEKGLILHNRRAIESTPIEHRKCSNHIFSRLS